MSGITVPTESRVRYLKRRQQELAELLASQSNPEVFFENAKKIGHQVKGNAITFDFAELTENAKALESAALKQDSQAVLELARELEKQVETSLSALV